MSKGRDRATLGQICWVLSPGGPLFLPPIFVFPIFIGPRVFFLYHLDGSPNLSLLPRAMDG